MDGVLTCASRRGNGAGRKPSSITVVLRNGLGSLRGSHRINPPTATQAARIFKTFVNALRLRVIADSFPLSPLLRYCHQNDSSGLQAPFT